MLHRILSVPLCAALALGVPAVMAAANAAAADASFETLDIDANGAVDALTDGLMLIRYTFGLRGPALIAGAIGSGAARQTSTDIEAYIGNLYTNPFPGGGSTATLDVDGNGSVDALTDGLLLMRYIFGLRGPALIAGAVGGGATRQTSADIETYLGSLYSTPPNGGTAPGGCSIAQSPDTSGSPVAPGTSVTLTTSCTSGNAATSCAWNNGIASTTCAINVTPSVTTTYSVVASNAYGSAPSASSTVNVAVQGGQSFCSGNDLITSLQWPADGEFKIYTTDFGNNMRIAFRFTVPTTFNPPLDNTKSGHMALVEAPTTPVTAREVTVSKNACDFQSGNYLYQDVGAGETAPYVTFTVNNPGGYKQYAQANLMPGDTIYLNVRNQLNGQPTCPNGAHCDMLFELKTP